MSADRAYSVAERERALQRAEEVGAAQAAQELGVKPSTLRSWRHRAGEVAPPAGADPASWAETKRRGAEETWARAQEALELCRKLIRDGDPRKAQAASVTLGILLDKAAQLETAAQVADERAAALTEQQAGRMADLIQAVFADVGVPVDGAVARLLRAHLEDRNDAEAAEEAKRQITETIGKSYVAEHPELTEQRPPAEQRREPLALPRGEPPHPDGEEHEPMVGPRKAIRTLRERRKRKRREEPEEEVTGEVVEDGPKGQAAIEEAAQDPQARIHWDDDLWSRKS